MFYKYIYKYDVVTISHTFFLLSIERYIAAIEVCHCMCRCLLIYLACWPPHLLIYSFIYKIVAVKGIKRQQLVEIRTLPSPPLAVKMAIESICDLLGEEDLDWKALRSVIMRENFISSIVNFDAEYLS